MAQKMINETVRKILQSVNEPLTTGEIMGRLSDRRYKNTPSIRAIGQILTRDKCFVKVEFDSGVKQCQWTVKEETK